MANKMGFEDPLRQAARQQYRYVGHAKRGSKDKNCAAAFYKSLNWELDMRQAWSKVDPKNALGWKRPSGAGRTYRWEDTFVKAHGESWEEKALDRDSWKAGEEDYIKCAVEMWERKTEPRRAQLAIGN